MCPIVFITLVVHVGCQRISCTGESKTEYRTPAAVSQLPSRQEENTCLDLLATLLLVHLLLVHHCSHDGTQLRNVLQRSKMTSNKYANNPFSLILTAKSNIRAVTVCSTDFPIHISTQKHCTQNSSISTHKASLKCCKTFHRQENSSR